MPKPLITAEGWLAQYVDKSIPVQALQDLRKDDLLVLSVHYDLDCRPANKKLAILVAVCDHLDENGLLEGESPSPAPQVKPEVVHTALEQAKEHQVSAAAQVQDVHHRMEVAHLEHQLAMTKLDAVVQETAANARLAAAKAASEVAILKAEVGHFKAEAADSSRRAERFLPQQAVRLVPPFMEDDLEAFFCNFERKAAQCKWPPEQWTLLLSTVFTGRAAQAHAAVSEGQCTDYKIVKAAVLQAYEMVPEAYRQRFRESRRAPGQTYAMWGRDLVLNLQRWTRASKVASQEDLEQLVLFEAVRNAVPPEVQTHIDEHDFKSVEEALTSADNFVLTHKVSNERPKGGFSRVSGCSTGNRVRPSQPIGQTPVPQVTEGVSRTRNARHLEGDRGGPKGNPSLFP
jgi:hypothetical protein